METFSAFSTAPAGSAGGGSSVVMPLGGFSSNANLMGGVGIGGGNSSGGGGAPTPSSLGGVSSGGDYQRLGTPPLQQQQHHHHHLGGSSGMRPMSAGSGGGGGINATPQPGGIPAVALMFSTSAAGAGGAGASLFGGGGGGAFMSSNANSNSNTLGGGSGGGGGYHLSASLDTPTLDDEALRSITQTLSVLQSIAEGCRVAEAAAATAAVVAPVVIAVPPPPPDFTVIMDPSQPRDSARLVSAHLARAALLSRNNNSSTARAEALAAVARGITTPPHVSILNFLDEPFKNEVRDLLLQHLLDELTNTGEEQPMPVCAEMLAELAKLGLVRLSGVAVAVERFLSQPGKRRAGLAVLGRLAEHYGNEEGFLRAVQSCANIEPLLHDLYRDPAYEYDVLAITRMLGGGGSSSVASGVGGIDSGSSTATGAQHLVRHCSGSGVNGAGAINTESGAPPASCIEYMRCRDELVVAHANGTVVVWGSPNEKNIRNNNKSSGSNHHKNANATSDVVDVKLRHVLPTGHVPVAMSGAPGRGKYVAVVSMPCPEGHPYRGLLASGSGLPNSNSSAAAAATAVSTTLTAAKKLRGVSTAAHHNDSNNTNSGSGAAAVNLAAGPAIRILVCDAEGSGAWALGPVISRPPTATVTAVAAHGNSIVCVAESTPLSTTAMTTAPAGSGSGGDGGSHQHSILMFSAVTGRLLHTVTNAHTDFITVLSTCEESERLVLSGSKDREIKIWSVQPALNSPVAAAAAVASTTTASSTPPAAEPTVSNNDPLHALDTAAAGHTDTITAIYTFRQFIFTGACDGTMRIWNMQSPDAPVWSRSFVSPILDITALEGGRAAVATARGLYLISLETMGAFTIVPNEAYTQIRCNDTGRVLFAASQDGVSVFSVKK